jgi:hypothetical protein
MQQYPKPAKNFIPKWYKDISRLENNNKKLTWPFNYQSPNLTLKTCVPFLESLSNGYMVYLSDDVFVEQIDGVPNLRWHQTDEGLVSGQGPDQFPLDNVTFYKDYNDFWDYLNQNVLSFDYVEANTFDNQEEGYWRLQFSWGGPSDEIRYYIGEGDNVREIYYVYMDWFDGASVRVLDGIWHTIYENIR